MSENLVIDRKKTMANILTRNDVINRVRTDNQRWSQLHIDSASHTPNQADTLRDEIKLLVRYRLEPQFEGDDDLLPVDWQDGLPLSNGGFLYRKPRGENWMIKTRRDRAGKCYCRHFNEETDEYCCAEACEYWNGMCIEHMDTRCWAIVELRRFLTTQDGERRVYITFHTLSLSHNANMTRNNRRQFLSIDHLVDIRLTEIYCCILKYFPELREYTAVEPYTIFYDKDLKDSMLAIHHSALMLAHCFDGGIADNNGQLFRVRCAAGKIRLNGCAVRDVLIELSERYGVELEVQLNQNPVPKPGLARSDSFVYFKSNILVLYAGRNVGHGVERQGHRYLPTQYTAQTGQQLTISTPAQRLYTEAVDLPSLEATTIISLYLGHIFSQPRPQMLGGGQNAFWLMNKEVLLSAFGNLADNAIEECFSFLFNARLIVRT